MPREKYNQIHTLQKRSAELVGPKRLSLIGQGDFNGGNNVTRSTMNEKHHTQHLTIRNPEFPFVYDGKENLAGEFSSFHTDADKNYTVHDVVKKYNELLHGKSYTALYFLYCKEDNSYRLVERNEVENLTESFGFDYKNDYIDTLEVGDFIPKGTQITASTSYDDYGNVPIGVNARIAYAVHPSVQDDAIICSESFAKRMVITNVKSISIPINDNTILLNLYGENGEYRGLPNIGEHIKNGVLAATRTIKETRMFSDLRDSSLSITNEQSDNQFYADGEIIDINVYCNNPNVERNKVNAQLVQYYNDARWFYTKVYKVCKHIINSGATTDREIHRWMRLAKNYLDTQAKWSFNENAFNNMLVEVLIRKREKITVGRKIVGRHGNKTVVSAILPDDQMPYMATEIEFDKYGRAHAVGPIERAELMTNPISFVNRTTPMAMNECSMTFILDRARKYAATLPTIEEKHDFLFDIIRIFNKHQYKALEKLYNKLSDKARQRFINDCISLNPDGTLRTDNGVYLRWDPFSPDTHTRDSIVEIYTKYGDIIKPYHIFMPKPKWGRDIYIGQDCIGYQYIMMLKQSGEKGFSVRSAGAISDESLPEKSHDNKIGKLWHSEKPIRFGEYETPNFMIICNPEDFALITALYRSSVDGRRFMSEAILSEDGNYSIPDKFTSRSAEILQVYLKSLGVRMETVIDEDEFIDEDEVLEKTIAYPIANKTIFCTRDEMYYLKKLHGVYKEYMKAYPHTIDDPDDVWEYILTHLPFKKKHLTTRIIKLFDDYMDAFSITP